MEALTYLTVIAVVLLLGLLGTMLAKKLGISNVLVLILLGIGLWHFNTFVNGFFTIPSVFTVSVSVLALAMLVFDGTSRYTFRDMDVTSFASLKLSAWTILANVIILTPVLALIFYRSIGFDVIPYAAILAILLAGTDAAATFTIIKDTTNRAVKYLQVEAVINTPLTVLLPFIVLDLAVTQGSLLQSFTGSFGPFLQQIFVGAGSGLVIGLVLLKVLRKVYNEQLSPLALLVSALLSYTLAESLAGNGVLAVAVLGLLFGNFSVRNKTRLQEFSSILSTSLEILVFALIGLSIYRPLPFMFYIIALVGFIAMLGARYLAVMVSFRRHDLTLRETLFMTLTIPKGIATAVVALTFLTTATLREGVNASHVETLLSATLIFIIYSIILAEISARLAPKLLESTPQPK